MTITSQQVDAWDAEVDAAYEAGRQEGMKQERALWELSKLGQEIEAEPKRTWVGLTDAEIDVIDDATWDENHKSWGIHDFARAIEAKLKEKNT